MRSQLKPHKTQLKCPTKHLGVKEGIWYALEVLGVHKPTVQEQHAKLKLSCPFFNAYMDACVNKDNPIAPKRRKHKPCNFKVCPFKTNNFQVKYSFGEPNN